MMIALLLVGILIVGCGKDNSQEPPNNDGNAVSETPGAPNSQNPTQPEPSKQEPPKPVSLVWYGVSAVNDEFMAEIVDYVQRKYPHISLTYVNNEGDNTINNVVATKTQVDLLFSSYPGFGNLANAGLIGDDIDDLIKKYNFDLDRIDGSYIDLFRSVNDGKLAGLPFYDLRRVMFYNKDIFDKFAQDYPEDGMTWEETVELARKLTVSDGGVQYRGFTLNPSGFTPSNQYSTPYLDEKTNKAVLQTEQWKQFIETYVPLYTMSGYQPTRELLGGQQNDLFLKDQTSAMLVFYNSDAAAITNAGINWDATTYPEVSSLPGIGSQPYPVYVALSSIIKPENRDAAFLVLEQLLSDEVQKERSAKKALATPLKSNEIKTAFGQDVEVWKGKNINAVTAQKPAAYVPYSRYNSHAQAAINEALVSVIVGEKDVNTALREAEEKANQAIEEAMNTGK